MSEEEVECREVIYNLTQLGSRGTVKPAQLIILYTKKIKSIEAELDHLRQTLKTYAQSLARIASMLDCDASSLEYQEASVRDKNQLTDQLKSIQFKLTEYIQRKGSESPLIIEKTVEVEVPVEVVVEKEVQRIVEVPVQREVIVEVEVERIIEVEKPVYIERLVQVEVPVEVEKIVQVEKLVHVTHEIEVEVPCPRCKSRKA